MDYACVGPKKARAKGKLESQVSGILCSSFQWKMGEKHGTTKAIFLCFSVHCIFLLLERWIWTCESGKVNFNIFNLTLHVLVGFRGLIFETTQIADFRTSRLWKLFITKFVKIGWVPPDLNFVCFWKRRFRSFSESQSFGFHCKVLHKYKIINGLGFQKRQVQTTKGVIIQVFDRKGRKWIVIVITC